MVSSCPARRASVGCERLTQRTADREPVGGPAVAEAQGLLFASGSSLRASASQTCREFLNSRGEWHLRRDDPRRELLLAKRALARCCASELSGLRALFQFHESFTRWATACPASQ